MTTHQRLGKTDLLDHGYLMHIETWGCDELIVESARMSTDGAFRGWGPDADGKPGDEKLLRYLYEHKHSTPFEMAGMTIEVQAPIFVFRQWHRHRTQGYSELSARYTTLPELFYIPSAERITNSTKKGVNKQASGKGTVLSLEQAFEVQDRRRKLQQLAREQYEWELSLGIASELARCDLPVSQYSRMRATANLRNWLGFLTLRSDPHAQEEIRVYADTLGNDYIKQCFPRTWGLFCEGRGSQP